MAVEKLLRSGVPVDALECKSLTACHYAAFYGQPEVLALLIKAGANIDYAAPGS